MSTVRIRRIGMYVKMNTSQNKSLAYTNATFEACPSPGKRNRILRRSRRYIRYAYVLHPLKRRESAEASRQLPPGAQTEPVFLFAVLRFPSNLSSGPYKIEGGEPTHLCTEDSPFQERHTNGDKHART